MVGRLAFKFFDKNKLNFIPDQTLLFITINNVKLVEKAANYTVECSGSVARALDCGSKGY